MVKRLLVCCEQHEFFTPTTEAKEDPHFYEGRRVVLQAIALRLYASTMRFTILVHQYAYRDWTTQHVSNTVALLSLTGAQNKPRLSMTSRTRA